MNRLSDATHAAAYDRRALSTGIVHLGIGAFHRAHMAAYTEHALAGGDRRWGILGASLRSPATRDALAPQDGLYTLAIRGEGERLQVVGALRGLLVAPEAPGALLDALCAPDTRIASLTVTEKGYCHDPATGTLDEAHPDVIHDLANPGRPRSALGFLAAAVARRRKAGLAPFTVLCCDNLPANGRTVHGLLTRFATLRDPDLGAYVAGELACPDTMVDRIVPATTDADRASISTALGLQDAWPVVAEPFTQWVIEDRFPAGRPDWAAAGTTLTGEVAPFEAMKLRLLNASHSGLAYLGALAGCETVADAMADPALAAYVAALMAEAATTLRQPQGADLPGYQLSLQQRFRNPALRHRTAQIAMDGSQKLPQRLLGTVRDRLGQGRPIPCLALAVAAWMGFVARRDTAGRLVPLQDPMADRLMALAGDAGPVASRLAPALLGVSEIFGTDLAADPRFTRPVTEALGVLLEAGVHSALQAVP